MRDFPLLNSTTGGVTPITRNGAQPHWNSLHFHSYSFWVSDSVEGFISDAVIPVELLYSSRTAPFLRSTQMSG